MSAAPGIAPVPVGQQPPPRALLRQTQGGHSAARAGPSCCLRGA
jgi:hypothetical protein